MLNSSDFEIYISQLEQALLPPSREILLTLSLIAVLMNIVSLTTLGRLRRPLTTFQVNLVNLAVSDLMLAVTMAVAICVNIYIQAKIPSSQNARESVDGASTIDETTNVTENATIRMTFGEDTPAHAENIPVGLINLACFERFTICLMSYFTLLPLMATTSLVYHQLTTVWYPLDLTRKFNKKPTAFFVILSYLIPAVSFSAGIIFKYIRKPQDSCLAILMSQPVYLAVSGTVSIITAIAFVGNTVMLALLLCKARKQMSQAPSSKDMAKAAFKLSLTIAMLWATVFALWSTGVVAFMIYFLFDLIPSPIPENFSIVNVVAINLYMLNPLVDPIIYGLRIPEVKQACMFMLCFNNPKKLNSETSIDVDTIQMKSVESQSTRKSDVSFVEENV